MARLDRAPIGKAPTAPIGPLIADLRRANAEVAKQQVRIEELRPERLAELRATLEDLKQQIHQGVTERRNLELQIDAAIRQVGVSGGSAARNDGRRGGDPELTHCRRRANSWLIFNERACNARRSSHVEPPIDSTS